MPVGGFRGGDGRAAVLYLKKKNQGNEHSNAVFPELGSRSSLSKVSGSAHTLIFLYNIIF